MVTVLRAHGLRIVIFANDHQPAHVHVFGDGEMKIDLRGAEGAPELVWAEGMSRSAIRHAMRIVTEQYGVLLQRWEDPGGATRHGRTPARATCHRRALRVPDLPHRGRVGERVHLRLSTRSRAGAGDRDRGPARRGRDFGGGPCAALGGARRRSVDPRPARRPVRHQGVHGPPCGALDIAFQVGGSACERRQGRAPTQSGLLSGLRIPRLLQHHQHLRQPCGVVEELDQAERRRPVLDDVAARDDRLAVVRLRIGARHRGRV